MMAAVLPLTACAGSAYQLPMVHDHDVGRMQQKIAAQQAPLKIYERSDRTYEQMVSSITNRLMSTAQPLCSLSEYPECYFQVSYSSDDTVNAYASEGYKITIFRGLLQYLETEDEIATVIAHEMGHHLAHHNQETEQNAVAGATITGLLAAVVLAAASDGSSSSSYLDQHNSGIVEDMMGVGAEIGSISYSKEQEKEADLLGAYLLARAGYDLNRAQNLLYVLGSLPGDDGNGRASLTDTHPASAERLVAWERAIDEIRQNPNKLPYLKTRTNIQGTRAWDSSGRLN